MAKKNRLAAASLAILVGMFGIHKFYLGRSAAGILYLLFCWTGLPGLVGLVEGIVYLFQSDGEFDSKYNIGLVSAPEKFLPDPIETLKRLEGLRQEGLISEQEFEIKRRQLLDRIS